MKIEFAAAAEDDLVLIFEHLLQAYQDLGDDWNSAYERAQRRISAIQMAAQDLAKAPHQGTLRTDMLSGLRFARRDKAVFWFIVDEKRSIIQVLAIFFGGQDHIRHMLLRLLG